MLCFVATTAAGAGLTGKEIMTRVKLRPAGVDRSSTVHLKTVAADGFQRVMVLTFKQKDYGKDRKTIMYFTQPPDIAGTGLLLFSYDEYANREDDIWLYLPALRKIKRIAARDRDGPFMGTDFAYADLERIHVSDYRYKVIGEETIAGRPTYHLAATAASERTEEKTGYSRLELWIDKDRWLIVKELFYDRDGRLKKKYTVGQAGRVHGFWTTVKALMENVQTGSKTYLDVGDVRFDSGVDDHVFDKSTLRRGLF